MSGSSVLARLARRHAAGGLVVLAACGGGPGAAPGAAGPDPFEIANPELLVRADLQELLEAGLDRRSHPLIDALSHDDPAVRAIAAYALASVQDPRARPRLAARLDDPDPRVRVEAAFAIGQLRDTVDGPALTTRLRTESEPVVRVALHEAAGKAGDGRTLRTLLAVGRQHDAHDRRGLALGLFHFGRRGVADSAGGPPLLSMLADADPRTSATAALALAAPRSSASWGVSVADVRAALHGLSRGSRAAGPLLAILAREGDPDDLPAMLQWLEEGEDWTVRVAAARALGDHPSGPSAVDVDDALFAAIADPSPHVAATAARGLVERSRRHRDPRTRAAAARLWAEWIRTHPERPAVAAALLPGLAGTPEEPLLLAWARGDLGGRARAALAWPALVHVATPEGDAILTAGLRGDRRDAYVAAAALAERLTDLPPEAPLGDMLIPLVTRRIRLWGPHAPMSDLRGLLRLIAALSAMRPEATGALLAAAAAHPHPSVRALATHSVEPRPAADLPARRAVDWALLASAGPRPRVAFETTRGTFVVELIPEAAPLAVSALLDWARSGRLDGLTFHRVEADFILQSGDIASAAGYGGPTRGLRSEFTRLRYGPGILGIASAGKDTEGSQYFITHGYAPSLDGRYGAVGRIVSGQAVADAVELGDPVLSVTPLQAEGGPSRRRWPMPR